jgi:hyaluronan synthase
MIRLDAAVQRAQNSKEGQSMAQVMRLNNSIPEPDADQSVESAPRATAMDWMLRGAILLGLAFIVYVTVVGRLFHPLLRAAGADSWVRVIVRPSLLWAMMGSLLLMYRTVVWLMYKPFPSASPEDAPFMSVIIPAYNEGAMVRKSIESVASAFYPRDRLEILVVDDGSTDDTWDHIRDAAGRHPGLVTTVRFQQNRGKRAALETGFRRARGKIAVTIDSDSVIQPGTLLALAGPFRDPRIGAVAGKVVVYNRAQGLIPKMLQVRFVLSFDFLRATQSAYRTVYCCPGALAGYRVSVVRQVLDAWMNQKFLNTRCTYGEDRALTNFILERGFDAVYQRSAVVRTIVPWTYQKLCRMYLRWDRSYVREEIRFARIVWKRPLKCCLIAFFDKVVTNLRFPVGYASLILLVIHSMRDPASIIRLLFAIGLVSSVNMLYYLHSERSWDFVYGIFYSFFSFFTLFWIFPYAAATVRSRAWMTR